MRKLYIHIAILTLFVSCTDKLEVITPTEVGNEIVNVQAEIGSGMQTRAAEPTNNVDYIGRDVFVENDVMVLTKIHRTTKPLDAFSYTNVHYTSNSNRAWNRDTNLDGFDKHERIYWSDNKNGHTFIGYSIPQTWDKTTKWVQSGSEYSGQFSYTEVNGTKIVDFTVLDSDDKTDLVDEEVKDANGNLVNTGNKIDLTGTKLKNEDLLLTYNTEQKADVTGLNTTIYYRHALASLRVIVDIQGFSPSSTAQDTKTTVHNLVVKNQPWKYKWTQATQAGAHGITIPGWGVDNITTPEDGTVDIKTWQPRPAGEGTGQAKKFTFYSLIVPGQQENLTLDFEVTYPKYLNPAESQTKSYRTTIPAIDFLPGYTTTILLSLNHEGEPVYIGAEYIDWENVETPDRSELQKISIFLDTSVRTDASDKIIVSIAQDGVATKDDATWLYYLNGDKTTEANVRDIYGHTGSPTDPFIIKTARQLLSFAYEVKSGRKFTGQYIKLDSDIYLQKTTDGTDILWPGVGDDTKDSENKYTHAFEGVFLGDGRYIKGLNGQPFFNIIGDYAVVDKVNFSKVINVVGTGVVANVNNGLIAGCNVEGNVTQEKPTNTSTSYCGSIVGENTSFIVACTHVGDVAGYGYVGGLVGSNAGALVACYHAGLVEYGENATDADKKKIDGTIGQKDDTKSIVFSCYQNSNLAPSTQDLLACRAAWPLTTLQMQSEPFVKSTDDNVFGLTTSTPTDNYSQYIEGADHHYSLNTALQEFSQWVKAKADLNADVTLPCHTFTAAQVQTLNNLFSKTANGQLSPNHLYKYSPATYPKVQ
ncbi:MAG: hypothetical protein MJY79_08730 [Bacteroidaceae bacterium]|nr:hypothetical protein [Bacteroidaceae bacterium]